MSNHTAPMPGAPHAANVIAAYRGATRRDKIAGLRWYADAHTLAASIDPGNVTRAAGVLAALSPRTGWDRNVALARRAYADGRATGTLGVSCRAADRIMGGELPLDVLNGPKVRAFFQLIADPARRDVVCVDRHAVDVALGQRLTGAERERNWRVDTPERYGRIAACYVDAGRVMRRSPGDMQAVGWLAQRTAYGIDA